MGLFDLADILKDAGLDEAALEPSMGACGFPFGLRGDKKFFSGNLPGVVSIEGG